MTIDLFQGYRCTQEGCCPVILAVPRYSDAKLNSMAAVAGKCVVPPGFM